MSRITLTRRGFLQAGAAAGAGAGLLFMGMGAREELLAQAAAGKAIPGFDDDRVLVILELAGGNDGLNTVIPFTHDKYYSLRPQLAHKKDTALKLSDDLAFSPMCAKLNDLFGGGKLAIVNGVGYPQPDHSHFRSSEIWHTASDADKYLKTGWIGRYLLHHGKPAAHTVCGVNLGPKLPAAFWGSGPLGVSFEEPDMFRWVAGKNGSPTEQQFRELNKTGQESKTVAADSSLLFLRQTTYNLASSSDEVSRCAAKQRKAAEYPANKFARSLRHVADLLAAGLPTRIYYLTQGGFDTHAGQAGPHDTLLSQLSASLAAFQADLTQAGLSGRVLTLVFSEFGRRVKENASRGTDHGTAGPMLLLGDCVNGGLYGEYPNLDDLDNGDLKFTTDFRSVYGSVLEDWLNVEQKQVLGKAYPTLKVIKA